MEKTKKEHDRLPKNLLSEVSGLTAEEKEENLCSHLILKTV